MKPLWAMLKEYKMDDEWIPNIKWVFIYLIFIVGFTIWQETGISASGNYYPVIYIVQFIIPFHIIYQLYHYLLPSGKNKSFLRVFLFITSVILIIYTLILYANFLESRHGKSLFDIIWSPR